MQLCFCYSIHKNNEIMLIWTVPQQFLCYQKLLKQITVKSVIFKTFSLCQLLAFKNFLNLIQKYSTAQLTASSGKLAISISALLAILGFKILLNTL